MKSIDESKEIDTKPENMEDTEMYSKDAGAKLDNEELEKISGGLRTPRINLK